MLLRKNVDNDVRKDSPIGNNYIVLENVRHSQRMNDPFVTLWIITDENGTIIFIHCV